MKQTVVFLGLAALVLLAATALAQVPEQTYDLSWWTVDGGGATFSTGGGYSLGGTIGQPDPGVLSGGGYELGGGFWGGGVPAAGPGYHIYLPLVVRGA
jgi:uncharacterized membrane protein